MDKELSKQDLKFEALPTKLEFENAADAAGFWFAAAVFCAVLAAAVIVYRTGNTDFRTASNDATPPAAQAEPVAPAPIVPQVPVHPGSGRS
jgi:hypothetical protein